MQQIKGNVLRARMDFVREHFGDQGMERVLALLSPDDRQALRSVLTIKWYPFALGQRLDAAIVQGPGQGRPELFERLGEASASRNLQTLHKGFLCPGDPQAFLAKAPVIYDLYYETGNRTYQRSGEREGVLTTHDAETFSAPDCLTVIGWYRRALELCGAREVSITEEECRASGGTVCRYRVRWAGVEGPPA